MLAAVTANARKVLELTLSSARVGDKVQPLKRCARTGTDPDGGFMKTNFQRRGLLVAVGLAGLSLGLRAKATCAPKRMPCLPKSAGLQRVGSRQVESGCWLVVGFVSAWVGKAFVGATMAAVLWAWSKSLRSQTRPLARTLVRFNPSVRAHRTALPQAGALRRNQQSS